MALKDTFKHMRDLLIQITHDLEKADGGNKAAAQRVRTGTVKLEKIAKLYRKESIKTEKATKGQRRPSKKVAKAKAKVAIKSAAVKGKVKAKAKKAHALKTVAKARALSVRKPSAKLPYRRSFR